MRRRPTAASMPSPETTPIRLEANADAQTLTVGWADGHVSVYPYEGLKRACPCAECRGGHGAMAEPVDPIVFRLPSLMTYEIKRLEPAGHYALRIVWGDGHSSGLFRWEVLRGYCPSEAAPEAG
ncbi:MAG: DUF971 domain-containing protein [Bacteroidota bacterium]